jgi:replication factor C large subunit
MVPLTRKYLPTRLEEIIGNEEAKEAAKKWIISVLHGKKEKPIMIHGPPGIGKTSMAYALAREFDLELLEISSSSLRDKASLEKSIRPAFHSKTIFGKQRIILIDDIDAMTKDDRGGMGELADLVKEARIPVVMTANVTSDPKMKTLRQFVRQVQMKKVAPSDIAHLMKKIIEKENIKISEEMVNKIATGCSGDVRSALNDMESSMFNIRDRKVDEKAVLRTIFKSSTLSGARFASSIMDMDKDMLKLWLDENIAREYEDRQEIADAFQWLSKADVFDGRIMNRQYYGYLRYSMTLMTAGVGLSKKQKYAKISDYQFPLYLVEMSRSMFTRHMAKSIATKIGKMVHTSSKRIIPQLGFYANLVKRDAERAKIFYSLTDDELEFLMGIAG